MITREGSGRWVPARRRLPRPPLPGPDAAGLPGDVLLTVGVELIPATPGGAQ